MVIDDGALANSGLNHIDITDSVQAIGDGAFADCPLLTSVTFWPNVGAIDDNAFSNSATGSFPPLSAVYVRGKTTAEAEEMLSNVNLPSGCKVIGLADFLPASLSSDLSSDIAIGSQKLVTGNAVAQQLSTAKKPKVVYDKLIQNTSLRGRKLFYPTIC